MSVSTTVYLIRYDSATLFSVNFYFYNAKYKYVPSYRFKDDVKLRIKTQATIYDVLSSISKL